MNDLFGMGLHGNLSELGNVSLTTLPLANLGRPLGFLLLSRAMPAALTAEELHKVDLITCGLSHAIAACRQPIPPAKQNSASWTWMSVPHGMNPAWQRLRAQAQKPRESHCIPCRHPT